MENLIPKTISDVKKKTSHITATGIEQKRTHNLILLIELTQKTWELFNNVLNYCFKASDSIPRGHLPKVISYTYIISKVSNLLSVLQKLMDNDLVDLDRNTLKEIY